MGDEFSKYEMMRDAGSLPEDVYREAAKGGVDPIARIRLIRAVYSLSPRQAKEVVARAEGIAESLEEQLDKIAEDLREMRSDRE